MSLCVPSLLSRLPPPLQDAASPAAKHAGKKGRKAAAGPAGEPSAGELQLEGLLAVMDNLRDAEAGMVGGAAWLRKAGAAYKPPSQSRCCPCCRLPLPYAVC